MDLRNANQSKDSEQISLPAVLRHPLEAFISNQDLLKQEFWDQPLAQIAKATGLVITLYDTNMERISGPHTYSPLAQRLKENNFFQPGGRGYDIDRTLIQKCFERLSLVNETTLQVFGTCCFPAMLEGELVGAFIIGWVPEHFADPEASDHVSKRSGVPPMEVWQLLRMQPPMSPEKMCLYSEMLQTFSTVMLTQLKSQKVDREQTRILRVINQAGMELTSAQTSKEIGQATIRAIRQLSPYTFISVSTVQDNEGLTEIARFDSFETIHVDHSISVTQEQRVRIPIRSADNIFMGVIEIKSADQVDPTNIPELSILTVQVAVALQKAKLINDLEHEQTALSTANEALKNLHSMKDEFLATISHELRTPLNSILGWAELLNADALDSLEVKEAITAIERNAKVQSRLIEDLLDVSRIISGKMTLHRHVVDVLPILRQAIETVSPGAEAKGQKIEVQLPTTPLFVKGDPTRLQQIFWNILSNSVKFTPTDGRISVFVDHAGPYFRIQIADTGMGIAPEFIPHLFDRFTQADSSLSRTHGGLGLGLAIVRHLAELHGGTVFAESDGLGKGSKFFILIPQNMGELDSNLAPDTKD